MAKPVWVFLTWGQGTLMGIFRLVSKGTLGWQNQGTGNKIPVFFWFLIVVGIMKTYFALRETTQVLIRSLHFPVRLA